MTTEHNTDDSVFESTGNVFADLGIEMSDEDMLKVNIAHAITKFVEAGRYTQKQAAEIMEIDQPKVSKILRGRLSEFGVDWMITRLLMLGIDIEVRFKQAKSRKRGRIKMVA